MFSGITKSLGLTKVTDEQHDADLKKHKKGPYSLPPEENDDPRSVYVEESNRKYRISTINDFKQFREICNNNEGWNEKYTSPQVTVFDKAPEKGKPGETLNLIKVVNMFPKTSPKTLYWALHDNDFRKSWDTNMVEGFNICQLDPRNDIGYYSVNFPWPLHPREFINMRYWMEFDNGEFMILNRTVVHEDYPCTQKFVRGVSYFSGYYISPLGGHDENAVGCKMVFYAHSDIGGAVPHALINQTYSKMTPSIMTKLEENSAKYSEWVKKNTKRDEATFVPDWQTTKLSWDASKNTEAFETALKIVKAAIEDEDCNEDLKGKSKHDIASKLRELKSKLEAKSMENNNNDSAKSIIHDAIEYKIRRNLALKVKPESTKQFLESVVTVVEGTKKCCCA